MSAFPSAEHRVRLLDKLQSLGVEKVIVSFSGAGDSGQIEYIECFGSTNKTIDIVNQTLSWPTRRSTFDHQTHRWVRDVTEETQSLQSVLDQVVCDALETEGLDWYNDEGGQGTLTIDLKQDPPKINIEVGINYTRTEEHFIDLTQSGGPAPEDDDIDFDEE